MYDYLYLDILRPTLQASPARHIARRQPLRPVAYDGSWKASYPSWVCDSTDRSCTHDGNGDGSRGATERRAGAIWRSSVREEHRDARANVGGQRISPDLRWS